MPRDVHAALASAADAAASLRAQLTDLAAAVELDDEDAIVLAARRLLTCDTAVTDPHSPEPPGPRATHSGRTEGEPYE